MRIRQLLPKENNIKTIFIFKLGQLGNKIQNKAVLTFYTIQFDQFKNPSWVN